MGAWHQELAGQRAEARLFGRVSESLGARSIRVVLPDADRGHRFVELGSADRNSDRQTSSFPKVVAAGLCARRLGPYGCARSTCGLDLAQHQAARTTTTLKGVRDRENLGPSRTR